MVHCLLCPGGGIGRRARFRSVYRKMWRFEFSPGHQNYSTYASTAKSRPLSPVAFFAFGPLPAIAIVFVIGPIKSARIRIHTLLSSAIWARKLVRMGRLKNRPAEAGNESDRYGHQVVALGSDNTGPGELTDLECLADFLGRQQFNHAINLGRVRIRAARATLASQGRR